MKPKDLDTGRGTRCPALKWAALFLAAAGLFAQDAPRMQKAIDNHLGRPYVWGSTGLKSFDCSGFVWRVLTEAGMFMKRTTARKLFFSLDAAPPGGQYQFGNLVFFDDLKHVGIVKSPAAFYHAESSIGTTQSRFDPYWRRKVYGFRALAK